MFDLYFLESLKYGLTWVARPNRDNVNNFTILPAATSRHNIGNIGKEKMKEFVNDSRSLLSRYNTSDVKEFFFEQNDTLDNKKIK